MPKNQKVTRRGLPSSTGGSGPSQSTLNRNEVNVRKAQLEMFKKFLKGGK